MKKVSTYDWDKFMSKDEIEESLKIRTKMNDALTRCDEEKDNWAKLEEAYLGKQPEKDGVPNTRVNIILANIEGQAGELASQDIAVSCIGQSGNDQEFAEDARINLEWDIRHQEDLFGTEMDAARRLLKLGTMAFKICYDPYAFDGFGVPRIESPSIDRIVIDPKITSYRRAQDAEFQGEYISMSRAEAERMWGKDKAEAIRYGSLNEEDLIFQSDTYADDDENSWTLIQYWTKDDGKLRLREFAHCGLLLYDSFKGDDREENQKTNKVVPNSYYTCVYDKYPYVFRICYPREGRFYGMGDAELITNLQNMLNNLYDMIRIAARPNLLLVDTAANVDPDELAEEDFRPLPFDSDSFGNNNRDPVHVVKWGDVNENWWRLVSSVHQEVQRVLRYSSLMMGQNVNTNSATEAAIQQQQGSRATNIKQKILESALTEALNYCLGLDLQFRSGKKSMRLSDEKPEYRDINFDSLKNIPVMVDTEESVKKMFQENGNEAPDQQVLQRKGKDVTKSVALDVKVNIGAGMPKNPAYLADLANKLSQLLIMDANGQTRPAISWEEFRKVARDIFGFPLMDDYEVMKTQPSLPTQAMTGMPQMGGENPYGSQPSMDANAPLTQNGNPKLGPLNEIRGQA